MDFEFAIPVNGRQHKAQVCVKEDGRTVYEDLADMRSEPERRKLLKRLLARFPAAREEELAKKVSADYYAAKDRHQQAEAAARQAEARQAEAATPPPATAPAAEEPWPHPVDGPALLDAVAGFLNSYLVLPEWAAPTLALWLLHTYLADLAYFTPYLWVSSPSRECGKTTLLELLEQLAFRAHLTGGITAAALYRRIHRDAPTMLLDELDTRLKGDGGEALRGVLNTGFSCTGKVTICVGDQHEVQDFNTYCPKVLAGIGRLWDTVVSRSIPIRLRRASKAELAGLRKIRGDTIRADCQPYRRKLLRFAQDIRNAVRETQTETPGALTARQRDVWRPLLAIANETGGHWTETAPAAAVALHAQAPEEGDYGLLLLEDLRALFAEKKTDALFSEDIVQELVTKEDRPWGEYRADKPITKNGVAGLLKRFEIRPKQVRVGTKTAKGYKVEELAKIWLLYLPPPTPERNETSETTACPPAAGGQSPEEFVSDVSFQPGVAEGPQNAAADDHGDAPDDAWLRETFP